MTGTKQTGRVPHVPHVVTVMTPDVVTVMTPQGLPSHTRRVFAIEGVVIAIRVVEDVVGLVTAELHLEVPRRLSHQLKQQQRRSSTQVSPSNTCLYVELNLDEKARLVTAAKSMPFLGHHTVSRCWPQQLKVNNN